MAGRRAYGAVRSSFLFRIGSDIVESGFRNCVIRDGMLQRGRVKCVSILKESFPSQAFNNGFRELIGSVSVSFIQRVNAVLAWFCGFHPVTFAYVACHVPLSKPSTTALRILLCFI